MLFFFTSCNIDDDNFNAEIQNVSNTIVGEFKAGTFLYDNEGPHDYSFHFKTQEGFIETYESGSKSSYAGASVSLSSGDWVLKRCAIGRFV